MVGYAALLVILAGGMALSIRMFASVSEEEVVRLRVEDHEILLAEQLRRHGALIASNGRGYLLSADRQLLADVEDAARAFDDDLRALRLDTRDREGNYLAGQVTEAATAFRRLQDELLAARRTSPVGLVERFERELLPRGEELEHALDRLVRHKEALLRAAYDDAHTRRSSVETRLYTLLGLLASIGVVLSWYFTRRLRRAFEARRRAVVARDELMGIVAHDLRNPLGAVMMKAEVLRTSNDPETIRKHATTIGHVAHRMESLIASMLDVATLESGRFSVHPTPEPVEALVQDASEVCVAQAAAKQVSLERKIDPGSTAVRADHDRVVQVLSNLVGNAVKFTPPGGTVTVEARREAPMIHFTVSDTGPGIAPADLPYVFDRFWKRDTPGTKGTGLGLFIAKGIVEAHQGRIWVESPPHQGARFHFTLPAAQ